MLRPRKSFDLTDKNCYSDTGGKAGCDRIWNKLNEVAEAQQTHQDQDHACQQSSDNQSVHAVFCNNSGDDRCKCCSRTCDLDAASAQKKR